MFLRALTAFLVLPGIAAFALPLLIVTFDPWRGEMFTPGLPVAFAGLALLLWCVRDFHVSGKGTLAPWDPPQKLVVVGLYRYTRNPMYVGVLTLVGGWALLFASPLLAFYTVILAIAFHIRVVVREEPWLERQFGDEWHRYRTEVNRWWPKCTRK